MPAALDSAIPPRLANVPAFPPVVMKLLSLLGDENGSVANIAACIATDPIFSARILKRASAADMAAYEPPRDVLHALLTLGVERTRELSLTIATIAYLGSALKTEQLCRCWRHTVACAMIAAELARVSGQPPGEAYTAGLLHDIGRLGLITAYRADYEETIAQAMEEDSDLLELERKRFGVDHAEAGHWLAARWNLPETVVDAALHHHDEPSGEFDIVGIVQMACRLADVLGYSVSAKATPLEFDLVAAILPQAVRIELRSALPKLQKEIAEQIGFFGYTDTTLPVRPLDVRLDEDEENDFLADFPDTAWQQSRSEYSSLVYSRLAILAALIAFIALVLSRLYR